MATTTTLTSLSSSKTEKKILCSICESQPYDLICTCGDKFDFNCIQQHVEFIGLELQDQYEQVSKKLARINDLKSTKTSDIDANRTAIDHWKRKRIQDINDIAEKAINDAEQRENFFQDISSFQETYDQVSADLHRVVHDNLNTLITLNQQLQHKIEDSQNLSASLIIDEKNLDASLQSKLNPSTSNTSETTVNGPFLSYSSISKTNETTVNGHSFPYSSSPNNNNEEPTTNEYEPITSSSTSQYIEEPRGRRDTEPTVNDLINTTKTDDSTNVPKTNDITNTPKTNDSINDDKQEEFEAGQTCHIQRNNPIIISTNNDEFAATVCCHNNQLLYNDYDRKTREFHLFFIPDINNPTVKETIPWNQLDATTAADDDEWIQDIIYSEKLSSYLLLNRVRLVQLNEDSRDRNELVPFHTFTDRTMKRIGCSDKYIYVTCSHGKTPYNGDEIILMNYQKEEQLRKTFRDIIPSRINRGAGALVGEISDLAVGANEQVIIGYRLERRHEVGVCLFNVINDGREWSCVKQLLLNDCWHSDLSYTPRLDWSDKLKLFTLIEYMTGHLIMIDRHGQVEGECRFMQVGNGNDSPINLAVSTNDWLCVRYQSSITIHKLTS